MGGASDEYEEELPPSDYNEDGILVTALASFSDIRLIRGRAPAAEQGAHPDRPESVRPATEGAPSGASALPASNGASAAEVSRQSTSNLHSHAAAENGHSGLANGLPNLGPPKPGGAAVPSIGNWAELAAQLKKRREELAAQQSAVAASLPASSAAKALPVPTNIGTPVRSGSNGQEPPQQPCTGESVDKLRGSVAEAVSEKQPHGRPDDKQSGGAVDAAAQTPTQLFSSGVGTPGASKPRPGVRSSAIGPLLARLRREATATEG
ncbi:MAG: hypothetical protein MMC33_007778 [Icmadophila ericetorum]|nr:hypothetical protein [Icmadophila ericetorum]